MLRTVTLTLLMFVSVVVMLPFASSTAHGIRQSAAAHQQRRYRRHSRAWWKRHRARLRLRRAAVRAHRNSPLEPVFSKSTNGSMPLAKLPTGWNSPAISDHGELRFQTESKALAPSQASIAIVAHSRPNPAYVTQREQSRMLSGVAFSDLRRIAIEKMINAGGWVINDYERQVDGMRVFVVIAQTPSDGRSPEKSWNFYFAEVDGNIYSLTLNTATQFSGSLAAEGQKFLASLRTKSTSSK